MGGRGSSSMSAMQRGALAEIARMEAEIRRIEAKPGVVEGQGVNRFISSSTSAMRDRQRVQGLRNAIASLRETYKV